MLLFFHVSPFRLSKMTAQWQGATGGGCADPLCWGEEYIPTWRRKEGTEVFMCRADSSALPPWKLMQKKGKTKALQPQVKHCCTGRPVGSPVTVFIIKLPITHVLSHIVADGSYCLRFISLVTDCTVSSCRAGRSTSKGADPTNLAGTAAGHTKDKRAPSNWFQ